MPYLCLLLNAFIWGLSWLPLRYLQERGLHPLWATMVACLLGAVLIGGLRPQAWRTLARTPALWVLGLAAGATNAAFNWGVSTGEVVRVVLLFYLMPLWAVGLAWWLLGERITPMAALRVGLALCGALLVLLPPGGGWPAFGALSDWLGVLGGMGFALTNVMLRRQSEQGTSARALAMFFGAVLVPAVLGGLLAANAVIPAFPPIQSAWLLPALALGVVLFAANIALQYGASRVPVHITSVVMLTEVVFASGSAVWLGGEVLHAPVLIGGALIMLAAVMATRDKT